MENWWPGGGLASTVHWRSVQRRGRQQCEVGGARVLEGGEALRNLVTTSLVVVEGQPARSVVGWRAGAGAQRLEEGQYQPKDPCQCCRLDSHDHC